MSPKMSARSGFAEKITSRPHLGPSQAFFCMDQKNTKHVKVGQFSLVGQWALLHTCCFGMHPLACSQAATCPPTAETVQCSIIGPKRLNSSHWPTKENRQNNQHFLYLSGPWKIVPKWGQEFFFSPTTSNADLADVLGQNGCLV